MSNKINYIDLWNFKAPQSVFTFAMLFLLILAQSKKLWWIFWTNIDLPEYIHMLYHFKYKTLNILERLKFWYLFDVFV